MIWRVSISQASRGGAAVSCWVSRCLLFVAIAFGSSALSSSPSLAIGCEFTTTDPSNYLSVTYYLTASSCAKTNPGSTLLLSASIDDFNASVTFFPASVVVASSVTSSACSHPGPPNSGNVAGYDFEQSTCNVLISLTNGATLSFDAQFAADGFANSVTMSISCRCEQSVLDAVCDAKPTSSRSRASRSLQLHADQYRRCHHRLDRSLRH